jgi:hypothetical protein
LITESTVEDAALTWLESRDWTVRPGVEIAPGELRVKDAEKVLKERGV